MSVIIEAEHPADPDAMALIAELDAHLEPQYPRESQHGFSVERLIADAVAFFVIRENGAPAGCGGIKLFGTDYGEIKRMYVRPQFRGLGFGKLMLDHLTDYARSRGIEVLRLETGIHQHAAIRLYEREGFRCIPPFGPYREDPVSRCYEKRIGEGKRTSEITTRFATTVDAAAIAAIYNEGIADRIATFETEPRTAGQIAAQLADKGDRFPTVVAEHNGHIVAWASAGAYRSRPAYAGVAEHSVYVARSARGKGAGRVVLDALCREYAARGFWKIVSRIFPENSASLALHERCGFRVVGVYKRHGKLEGAWRDCVIVERLLDE